MRQKSFIYRCPIYSSDILFIYYNDYRYANKMFEKYGFTARADSDDKGSCGYESIKVDDKEVQHFYLLIRHSEEDTDNILVHETLHLTQDILETKGIRFKKGDANEAYTYLQGWLFEVFKEYIQN